MVDLCNIFNKLTGCEVSESVDVVSKDPKARYSQIDLSLGASCEDRELYLAGSFIGVAYVSGGGTCEIKLDYTRSAKINLRQVRQIRANFSKIYFTCDGHGGLCRLYICKAMETTIDPSNKSVYSGTVRSYSLNSTNIVRRISSTGHFKANRIKIRNTHAANGVDLGFVSRDSIPDTAYFRSYAYRLIAQDDIEFTEVDLWGMGFVSAVDDAAVNLRMVATVK